MDCRQLHLLTILFFLIIILVIVVRKDRKIEKINNDIYSNDEKTLKRLKSIKNNEAYLDDLIREIQSRVDTKYFDL